MKYTYRGRVVIDYNIETQTVRFPDDPEGGGAFIQHIIVLDRTATEIAMFMTKVALLMTINPLNTVALARINTDDVEAQ